MKEYKRIPMEALKNCRDLGGYAGDGGRMVCYHMLYRSEAPVNLTENDWKMMQEMSVRTMIDLRSESEQKMTAYEVPECVERISYPLQQYEIPVTPFESENKESLKEKAMLSFGKSLFDGYTKMIEDAPDRMVFLLDTIAKALDKGAVLYHCTAGKDRTGVLSAVVYLLCGVADEDIIADYQVSATYQAKNPMFDLIPDEFKVFLQSAPETMEAFLKEAHEKDYIALLEENELSDQTIETIRKKILQ